MNQTLFTQTQQRKVLDFANKSYDNTTLSRRKNFHKFPLHTYIKETYFSDLIKSFIDTTDII